MNDRENLLDLFARCAIEQDITIENVAGSRLVDYLLANGVTVQRWIPVTERLPEENVRVLVHISGNRSYTTLDTDRLQFRNWVRWGNEVTHWMPLPEPPKKEAKEPVPCSECKHLMFSDCYGECSKAHRGIVRPDDTCPYGERRTDG